MSCRTSSGCLLCSDRSEAQTEVGQGPHEFRRAGRIAGAIRDITYVGYVKSPFPRRHACGWEKGLGTRPNMSCRTSSGCLLCNDRSEAQTEVGQGPHEFRRAGRIAGAIRDIIFYAAGDKK